MSKAASSFRVSKTQKLPAERNCVHARRHLQARYDFPNQAWQKAEAQNDVLSVLIDKCPEVIEDLRNAIERKDREWDGEKRLWEGDARRWATRWNLDGASWIVEWAVKVTSLWWSLRERAFDVPGGSSFFGAYRLARDLTTTLRWFGDQPARSRFVGVLTSGDFVGFLKCCGGIGPIVPESLRGFTARGVFRYDLNDHDDVTVTFCDPNNPHSVTPWSQEETERAFLTRARVAYRASCHAAARQGLVARPEPRKRSIHAEWLVLHQVKGWTEAKIAEHYQNEAGVDVSTVSKAITRLAKPIHLPLRPAPHGRCLLK